MERIAFDLVVSKKGVFFRILNSKMIPIVGLAGILPLLGFAIIYDQIYAINAFDYHIFKFMTFVFLLCIFIGILKHFGGLDGNYFEKKGLLLFDENEIIIDYAETYSLEKVKYIKFDIMQYLYNYLYIYADGKTRRYNGAANFFTFQIEEKIQTLQFIIASEGQKQLLIEKVIPQLQTKTKVRFICV